MLVVGEGVIVGILALVLVGRHPRHGARIGDYLSLGGLFAMLLGVLALAGIVDLHPERPAGCSSSSPVSPAGCFRRIHSGRIG